MFKQIESLKLVLKFLPSRVTFLICCDSAEKACGLQPQFEHRSAQIAGGKRIQSGNGPQETCKLLWYSWKRIGVGAHAIGMVKMRPPHELAQLIDLSHGGPIF